MGGEGLYRGCVEDWRACYKVGTDHRWN